MVRRPVRVAYVAAFAAALAILARPLPAQFEEPDTIPRFAVGAFVEIDFRGARGTDVAGQEISFGDATAVGARLEYRLTGTLTAGALGSFSRVEEGLESAGGRIVRPDRFTVWQLAGELLLRVKAGIPGYFVMGGGARQVSSGSDDPQAQSHNIESFTEPLGIFGAGLEVGSTRRRAFRVDMRVHFVSPADQLRFETKSLETDWSLGLGFMFRL
jgi:hypothetical protein